MKKFLLTLAVLISAKSFSQTAGFTIDADSGCTPLCSNFQDTSANAIAWLWDFGDASQGSTFSAPLHCYVSPGMYTVTLNVTFANNSTGTATHTITVFPNPIPNFTWSNAGNNTIAFTDQSVGATSWMWYFGDQTTSTLQNPVHTYASAGLDTVYLEIWNSFGCYASDSGANVVVVGLDEVHHESTLFVYPNPSDDGMFTVNCNSQESQVIIVENALGQCVMSKVISGESFIDLSNQPTGCYFVRMQNGSAQKILIR